MPRRAAFRKAIPDSLVVLAGTNTPALDQVFPIAKAEVYLGSLVAAPLARRHCAP